MPIPLRLTRTLRARSFQEPGIYDLFAIDFAVMIPELVLCLTSGLILSDQF